MRRRGDGILNLVLLLGFVGMALVVADLDLFGYTPEQKAAFRRYARKGRPTVVVFGSPT